SRVCPVAPVHLGCNLCGFRIDRDDRTQCRALHVVGFNPVEIELGQLRAGQLAAGERSVDAGNRRLLEMEWALLRVCLRSRNGHRRRKTDEMPEFPHDYPSWWKQRTTHVRAGWHPQTDAGRFSRCSPVGRIRAATEKGDRTAPGVLR